MKHHLPASITLLQCIAQQMPAVQPVFDTRSDEFLELKDIVESGVDLNENERFLSNPLYIRFLQVCVLLGLSMFKGIFVPVIKQCKIDDDTFTLTWDSLTTDTFTFGVYDSDFKKFISYYQDRLSSKPQNRESVPALIFQGILQFLKSYNLVLEAIEKSVNSVLGDRESFVRAIESTADRAMLFVVMACLPQETISALLVHVSKYFPEDLVATTAMGRKVSVVPMFEAPSLNIAQLLEKNEIYLDLYFDKDKPIVREITQSKTLDYLKKIMINKNVFQETQKNLNNIKRLQIDVRKQAYANFSELLDILIP
tara:strand:+ start:3944 stop:4876 length:933 start_codon:yes stop_codon:yes gene_type:complete